MTNALPGEPPAGPSKRAARKRQRNAELANASLRRALKPTSPSGALLLVAAALIVLWAIVGVDALMDHRLLRFGIKPRELGGLVGILVSPFLHADAAQLAADTIPFAVLCWLMLISGGRYFAVVTVSVGVVSGVTAWLAAPAHTVILGCSGLIFGWMGYVVARAWFGRKIRWIATAVAVVCIFSGTFSGLLPRLHTNVFWGDHLAGFLAGLLVGALLHASARKPGRKAGLRPNTSILDR